MGGVALGGGTLDSHEDTLDIQIPPEVRCFSYVFGGSKYLLSSCLDVYG